MAAVRNDLLHHGQRQRSIGARLRVHPLARMHRGRRELRRDRNHLRAVVARLPEKMRVGNARDRRIAVPDQAGPRLEDRRRSIAQ